MESLKLFIGVFVCVYSFFVLHSILLDGSPGVILYTPWKNLEMC